MGVLVSVGVIPQRGTIDVVPIYRDARRWNFWGLTARTSGLPHLSHHRDSHLWKCGLTVSY